MRSKFWLSSLVLLGVATAMTSCSSDEGTRGQLVIAVQTDMALPDDVDRIRLSLETFGRPVFAREYPVVPERTREEGALLIPATLAVLASDDPAQTVTIGISARQNGRIRVLREAVTTIPTTRVAMLRMPLQWLCDGQVQELEPGIVDTTCPDVDGRPQTCIAGSCADAEVDSSLLPDYDPALVFGGGDGEGSGECFDTVACFAEGEAVAPDDGCTIAIPDEEEFEPSVAILNPRDTAGICGPTACLVTLDANTPNGWTLTENEDRIQLPPAVCDRIDSGISVGVAVTTACPQKTEALPSCGPWSAVTTTPATLDAGPPANAEVGTGSSDGDCAVPGDSSRAAVCLSLAPAALDVVEGDAQLDGMGTLVVQVFDEPSLNLGGTAPTPLETRTFPADGGEIAIAEVPDLPPLRFDDLPPGPVYLLAQFWDNPAEQSVRELERGGAWLGGLDLSNGLTGDLFEIDVQAGVARTIRLAMRPVHRLEVSASVAEGLSPADDGNGLLEWVAYTTSTPDAGAVPIGRGRRSCANLLAGGPTTSVGFVVGDGPHYVVASLDDFGVGQGGEFAGTVAGSLVSGSPSPDGGWTIPDATDRIDFPRGSYSRSFSVELATEVPVAAPPPDPYVCTLGECGDTERNGDETDTDCGGGCAPCADGLRCAGAADCESRVCQGGICLAPDCSDGVQNGTETDQDCGGDCAACPDGSRCQQDVDCVSAECVLSVCEVADAGEEGSDASAP